MATQTPYSDAGTPNSPLILPTTADLAEIVQLVDDAIIVVDNARRIIFLNHSAYHLFRYERSELLGSPLDALIAPRSHYDSLQLISDLLRSPAPEQRIATRVPLIGRRGDGSEFSAEASIAKMSPPERAWLSMVWRDLTGHTRIERQLRLKSDALENSLTAFGIINLEGQVVYANRTSLKLWGYQTLDEVVGIPAVAHCIDPTVPARIIETVKRQGQCTLEFTARRKDGSTFEALMSVQKSINEAGEKTYIGTAIDITQHKHTTKHLAEQKELLETILQQAAEAIVVCDAQDNPILINAAARRLALGDSRSHTEASPKFLWGKAYYPDGHPVPLQAWPLQQALRGNTTVGAEARVVRLDNSYYDVSISAAPIRNGHQRIIGAVAIFSDITERKRVEEKLLYQLRLTQSITDSANDSILVTDGDGLVTFLNPAAEKAFGFSAEEMMGKPLHQMIHHHDAEGQPLPSSGCRLGRIFRTGETVRDYEETLYHKDGTALIMACSNAALETKGKRTGAVFFMRDITERKRAERALQESTARLQAIIHAVPDVLLVLDEEGRYLEILTAQPELLHTDPSILKGRLIREVLPPEAAQIALSSIRQTLLTRRSHSFEYELPIRKIGVHHFEARTAPLDGGLIGKPAVVLLARDITQHRLTEASLRQAQKMEAVGQLTGGVAHDFNNLLAVILGNLELLSEMLPDPALLDLVQRALSAVDRGTTLIRRLLAFSRKQPLQPLTSNLNTLVIGMSDLLRRSLGETIEIKTLLADDLLPTLIDFSQFETALLNLVVNARDSMPTGGRLTLETANRWLDEDSERRRIYEVDPGQYVMLSVSDTGFGMAPEIAEHAFEPFFTTKAVGQGSGLGLSMVYGLVKQSGGYIVIYSEVGWGTSVRMYLPAVINPSSGLPENQPSAQALSPGLGQTILVVEDEPQVRRLAVNTLKSLGYHPIEADAAAAALEILETTPHVAVLFTDVVLPGGQSGVELAQEARLRYPHLKVLFTSGYTEAYLMHSRHRPDGNDFLNKPYRKSQLADKLHALLHRHSPGRW